MTAPQTTSASYEVGYRKPPRHTQFQKGQSGNPGGRPRRSRRLEDLALYEAYRTTIVMVDGHAEPMPVIQAVLRSQLESAAGGNVRAQRDTLAMIRDIEQARRIAAIFEDGDADDVVDDDDVADTDHADANDDDDDNDVDDTAADHDHAGGADDDEPARQQADGIRTYGERQEEQERTAPTPAISALQPANAAAPPAGRTPSLPSGSGSGQRARAASSCRGEGPTPALPEDGEGEEVARTSFPPRGVLPRRSGPERSAGVKPARLRPGRRRRSPAVSAGKIREGHSGSSRRSLGRTKSGPRPAQAAGGHARAPAAPAERDEKLKTRC